MSERMPKFPECVSCIYGGKQTRRTMNPICKSCDRGEFFEERIRTRAPTDNELMKLYGEMYDEN